MRLSNELSGDIRLSPADRIRYLCLNAWRNIRTWMRGPRSRPFVPSMARARAIAAGQSPSCLLTELFIESELPSLSLPRQLNVLELGCGSGSMAYRLGRLGYRGRYTGVDIADRFCRDYPPDFPFATNFVQTDAHAFETTGDIDLMLSVSTLEHISADAALIANLPAFFNRGGLEVHVVPSGPSLGVYLWHGFRQYTPATLAAKFGPAVEVVRIGGFASYIVHIVFITIPELAFGHSWRKSAPRLYRSVLLGALQADGLLSFFPTAYAAIRRH